MGKKILVIGRSGSGKSASLRNFKKGEVGIVSVQGKELPFRTDLPTFAPRMNEKTFNKYPDVMAAIRGAEAKVLVIDDANYLMSDEFMNRSGEKGYEKFTQLAQNFYQMLQACDNLPDDTTVYIMMHYELDSDGYEKPKTIGKLLDEKIVIEGLFTTVLKAACVNGEYVFLTRTAGNDCVKAPIGMFEDAQIPNDLKAVDQTIREYYGMEIPYK